MAAHDLNTPPIAVQDDTNSESSPLDNPSFPTSGPTIREWRSLSGTHDFPPLPTKLPTLALTNYQTRQDVLSSPSSRAFDAFSSHPPASIAPTTNSVASRDINQEDDDLPSLGLLTPPTRGHCRNGRTVKFSIIGTDRDTKSSSSLDFPSPASSLKRIVRCVYYL